MGNLQSYYRHDGLEIPSKAEIVDLEKLLDDFMENPNGIAKITRQKVFIFFLKNADFIVSAMKQELRKYEVTEVSVQKDLDQAIKDMEKRRLYFYER